MRIARVARGAATVLLAGTFLVAAAGTTAYADDHGKGNGKAHSAGANGDCGEYCSTRDGSPSRNGNGGGDATGRPCAGCVGKADDKNPPGQHPNGSDANNGYECDGNSGIGRSNPAHTGCAPAAAEEPAATPVTAPVQAPGTTDAAPVEQTEAPAAVAGVKVVAEPAPAVGAVGAKAPAEPQDATGIGPNVLGTRFAKPASGPAVAGGEGSLPITGGTTAGLLLAAVALLGTGVLVTRAGSARA